MRWHSISQQILAWLSQKDKEHTASQHSTSWHGRQVEAVISGASGVSAEPALILVGI